MINNENTRDWAAVALLLLLVVQFFSPILFGNQTLFFRDVSGLLYPHYHFLFQSLHEGVYPFWNPAVFNGAPFLAALCPGIFYPPLLILLLDDFTLAYNLFNVFHYAFFTISVYALSRHFGVSMGASLCSAMTALFSGFFLSSIYFFLQIIWMPSVFLCFRKYAIDKKVGYLPGTAVCMAFQLLCGPPESCIMTLTLVYLHSILVENPGKALSRTLQLAGAVVLAVGLAAPQLLPTMALLKETVRGEGLGFEHHSQWSLESKILPTIILPKDHTGFMERVPPEVFGFFQSFHMGTFAVFFLCAGLLFLPRREIRFWLIVFGVGLFFSLGKYNPFYEFVYNGFPPLKLFRYPEKFYIFSAFAQIFLVGHVADELLLKARKPAGFFVAWAICCAAILGASFLVPGSRPLPSLAVLTIFAGGVYMFFAEKMSATALQTVLLLLIFFDLTVKHYMLVPMIDKKFFEAEPAVARQIKQDKDLFRVYSGDIAGDQDSMVIPPGADSYLLRRIIAKERLRPATGMIYGISSPYGLAGMGLELQDVWLWGAIFKQSAPEKRTLILQRGNVKYLVRGDETAIAGRVQALDNVLPRAFLVPKWRLGEDPKLLNTYYDASFDPRQEVLLSEPAIADISADFAGKVHIVQYEANRVVLRSRQNGDGFLVLLDSWFPGWTATVDGKPEHIYRANHFYRAVKTGSGIHTVEFYFEAPGFRMGMWVCISTLILMTFGIPLFHNRNKASPQ